MKILPLSMHIKKLLACLAVLCLLASCGGGGGSVPPAPSPVWITVESVEFPSPTAARVSGTAWVSKSWVGLHCVGLGCLFDQSTDNYPGVDVTWQNQTTGASGSATSYYGGGTDWEHKWTALVPLAPGANTVALSAFDPDGKGGSTTEVINGKLVLNAVDPASGASNVALNAAITVSFNSPIDPSSVTPASFSLNGPHGPEPGSYTVNGSTISFAPTHLFYPNTGYTAEITSGIHDSSGLALSSDVTWSFTTGQTVGTLLGIWGSSADDIFVVGAKGTILHYDGSGWTSMASGAGYDLHSVWGSSVRDVYAVGALGTILHYNGVAWAPMSSGTTGWLRSVWGRAANDVFAVDESGNVLHSDGNTWRVMSGRANSALFGVWGSAANDVSAVGMYQSYVSPPGVYCSPCNYHLIEHYEGSSWSVLSPDLSTPYQSPYGISTSNLLYALWGRAATDVYAAGSDGTILHYNGSNWTARGSGSVNTLFGLWGRAGNDVYAVGDSGTILHYDGSAWSTSPSPTSVRLTGVWGSAAADVYAVGYGALLHYDGTSWQLVHPGP